MLIKDIITETTSSGGIAMVAHNMTAKEPIKRPNPSVLNVKKKKKKKAKKDESSQGQK